MILSSLSKIYPIEMRIKSLKLILKMAKEKKDIFLYEAMYDFRSISSIRKELQRYLYVLENPKCYVTQIDNNIDEEAYKKMFGE